jgi:hypothetical protein
MKGSITGGPAIIFTRHHEVDKTRIRTTHDGRLCKTIVGFDCNGMYGHATAQPMPIGIGGRYVPDGELGSNKFKVHRFYEYAQSELEWLSWTAHTQNIEIKHRWNTGHVINVCGKFPDGYDPVTRTCYFFDGCYWHSCPNCQARREGDYKRRWRDMRIRDYLREHHYNVVVMPECRWTDLKRDNPECEAFLEEHFRFDGIREPTKDNILEAVLDGTFFGIVRCRLEVPLEDRDKWADMPPIFKNADVSRDDIGEHMREFCEVHQLLERPRRTLISSYKHDDMMIATPLLKWLLERDVVVLHIFEAFQFKSYACHADFIRAQTEIRRMADSDPATYGVLGALAKLMVNACYGTSMKKVEEYVDVRILNRRETQKAKHDPFYKTLEPLDDEYSEVVFNKREVRHNLNTQFGFFVYAYAKLFLLRFYYDFIVKYFKRCDYELVLCDTDSLYLAFSKADWESLVPKEQREEYEADRNNWLPRRASEDPEGAKFDARTPGLFHVEFQGNCIIALNPKTYYAEGVDPLDPENRIITKTSTKGCPKRQNKLTRQQFMSVLKTKQSVSAEVRSIRFNANKQFGRMDMHRTGLSYLMVKRKVQPDGIHTDPLNI